MGWYLQRPDGTQYGPEELSVLQRWAADGRIAPNDRLSEDREHWMPAPDVEDLHMYWLAELTDGSFYGPIHLLALRHLIEDGAAEPAGKLRHRRGGPEQSIGETLLGALLRQNENLQQTIDALASRLAEQADELERYQKQLGTGEDAAHVNMLHEWKEAAQQKDHFEREAEKWKDLYRQAQASLEQNSDDLEHSLREAKQRELRDRSQIEKMQIQIKQLQENLRLIEQTAEAPDASQAAGQVSSLLESYNELSRNFDGLLAQLSQKSEELSAVMDSRTEIQQRAEERIRHMEKLVQREQAEADQARRRLAEIEEAHLQIVRAYREMNDRYIRLKQQQVGETPPRSVAPSKPAQTAANEQPAHTEGDDWKPRVRLTR